MRLLLLATFSLLTHLAFSQDSTNTIRSKRGTPVEKGFVLKTNVLSAVAQRPTISAELYLNSRSSLELSYVSGYFEPLFWIERYKYKGVLLRGKFFLDPVERPGLASYFAVYLGTMRKSVYNERHPVFSDEYVISYTRNSLRAGGSFGGQYLAKTGLVLELQTSLGAGRYLNYKNPTYRSGPRGYFDFQLWFSVGYFF